MRQVARRSGGPWAPGDVLPGVQTPPYMAPMFELKPNHRGDLEDHERELGCECEDYGDTEWTRESEAMHWSPEDKSRVAALARLIELARARAIPEED